MAMEDRLLNAYLAGTVDDDAFKAKTAELKADRARVTEEIDARGRRGPGSRESGSGGVRLEPKGGRNLARFKHHGSSPDPGFDLFEPAGERRNFIHHKEKAVRLLGRTARFEEESG
ncbi:MAG: hypothetical protein ACK46M_05330 [Planctomyces sp.]